MKRLLSLAAVAMLLAATGCGSESSAPASYSTPEEAFEAFKTHAKNENWKGMAMALTPESQEAMCMAMMLGAAFAGMADEAAGKEIEAIMEKHGVSEDAMDPNADSLPIKDKPAFIAEIMGVMSKLEGADDSGMNMPEGELADLKIDGDSATATIDGEPISFKKINGSWLIHMDELAEGMDSGGPGEMKLGNPGDFDLGNPPDLDLGNPGGDGGPDGQ